MRVSTVERLFKEHSRGLFAFLVYRTGDRNLAEDLVADTFERVLRSRHRFNPSRGTEKQWIYSIGLNLVRDQARRVAIERRVTETVAVEVSRSSTYSPLETLDVRDQLQRALVELSDAERDVIALRFGADLTLREVARVLHEGESAVEARVYRGLAKLRELLE